jgi:hypothetical protein
VCQSLSSVATNNHSGTPSRVIARQPRASLVQSAAVLAGVAFTIATGFAAEPAREETSWHLVRSADPRGGVDAVAMTHTADMSKSDLGLAGLMLRCGGDDLQIVVVSTTPFAPRAHPQIKLLAGKTETVFTATVIPPFSALLLPPEATSLANGPWQLVPELLVEIQDQQTVIRGAIPLTGLQSAVSKLRASCPIR